MMISIKSVTLFSSTRLLIHREAGTHWRPYCDFARIVELERDGYWMPWLRRGLNEMK